MRHARWLTTILVVLGAFCGCTDARRQAGRRLAESVNNARQLYGAAVRLWGNPQYVLDVASGRLTPVAVTLETTQPRGGVAEKAENVLKRLDKARDELEASLSVNAKAPAEVQADAYLLLGQIQMELARYHLLGAEAMRGRGDGERLKAQQRLEHVRAKVALAAFYGELEKTPETGIVALKKNAADEVKTLEDGIKSTKEEIAKLEAEIDKLSKANAVLLTQVAELRRRSETAGGTEGLDLLKQAAQKSAESNANSATIGADTQRVADLKADLSLLEMQQAAAQAKLSALDQHLQDLAAGRARAAEQKQTTLSEAGKLFEGAAAASGDVVKISRAGAEQEAQALDALGRALQSLKQAETATRRLWDAAREARAKKTTSDEILAVQADDQRLASVMAMRSSASLMMGDLRRYQLTTNKANDALAGDLVDTAKAIGQEPPAPAKELTGYVPDPAQVQKTAEENYRAAETDLEDVLRSYLRASATGKNIQWIYQAHLAEAYLGHYLLTGNKAFLAKAAESVSTAAEGKEGSPYLSAVLELKRLINEEQAKQQ